MEPQPVVRSDVENEPPDRSSEESLGKWQQLTSLKNTTTEFNPQCPGNKDNRADIEEACNKVPKTDILMQKGYQNPDTEVGQHCLLSCKIDVCHMFFPLMIFGKSNTNVSIA